MVSSTPKDDSLLPPPQVSAAGTYTLKASGFSCGRWWNDSSFCFVTHPPLPLSFALLQPTIGRASRV